MVWSWTMPLSSSHFHWMVPSWTWVVVVPPKPLITLFDCLGVSMKSSMQLEIQAEHLLSMPTGPESVSNCVWYRSVAAVDAIAKAENIINAWVLCLALEGLVCHWMCIMYWFG